MEQIVSEIVGVYFLVFFFNLMSLINILRVNFYTKYIAFTYLNTCVGYYYVVRTSIYELPLLCIKICIFKIFISEWIPWTAPLTISQGAAFQFREKSPVSFLNLKSQLKKKEKERETCKFHDSSVVKTVLLLSEFNLWSGK